MITFNVGPSKISKRVKADIEMAAKKGVLEISHRSKEFTEISKKAILGMRNLLDIPKNYQIVFTASATESIQLAIQNCCAGNSFHFINGNFSQLFSKISKDNNNLIAIDNVEYGEKNNFKDVKINPETDFISITHNETSSGVMCNDSDIETIRKNHPDKTLAIDVTSSAGALKFNFESADLWIFSVQKCLGLPSGLGILIFSPRALKKSQLLSKQNKNKAGAFSLEKLNANMPEKFQTLSTPNVLEIYLLAQKIERIIKKGGLKKIISETKEKELLIDNLIKNTTGLDYFVKDSKIRSKTVCCLAAKKEILDKIVLGCKKSDLLIGNGYGELRNRTIRIANFPTITKTDYQKLINCIKNVLK